MTLRRWIHLASLLIPVGVLTVFNILGIEAGAPLLAALSALTTGGVAAGPGQSGQATGDKAPAKRRRLPASRGKGAADATRNPERTPNNRSKQPGPHARAVGAGGDAASEQGRDAS